ncbi:MAG: hypothetical protein QM758_06355 [Armatimonas sp.]
MRSTGKPHASNPQQFIGAPVITPGGAKVGTILNYTYPAAGEVNPLVEVQETFDPGVITLGAPTLGLPPGTDVELHLDGTKIQGTIQAFNDTSLYIDASHFLPAYHVDFGGGLSTDEHGAPVFTHDGRLVGMLIVADSPTANNLSLVCPC